MAEPFLFDRSWRFDVGDAELWDRLTATDEYRTWWRWLRRFDLDTFEVGSEARCKVRGPLPYALRFKLAIVEVVPRERLVTELSGDLVGPAKLEVRPTTTGSEARLDWSLELHDRALRTLAVVARPAMQWAHDSVVNSGVAAFREHALAEAVP